AGQGRDENVAKMIGSLVEQGVEVYRLDHEMHAKHAQQILRRVSSKTLGRATTSGPLEIALVPEQNAREVPAGSYLIFLNQPYRQNVLALFEPQVYPDRITAT